MPKRTNARCRNDRHGTPEGTGHPPPLPPAPSGTIAVAWWWFRPRGPALSYYAKVGAAGTATAIIRDCLFIVTLVTATRYGPDVFVYSALTVTIPAGAGLAPARSQGKGTGRTEGTGCAATPVLSSGDPVHDSMAGYGRTNHETNPGREETPCFSLIR